MLALREPFCGSARPLPSDSPSRAPLARQPAAQLQLLPLGAASPARGPFHSRPHFQHTQSHSTLYFWLLLTTQNHWPHCLHNNASPLRIPFPYLPFGSFLAGTQSRCHCRAESADVSLRLGPLGRLFLSRLFFFFFNLHIVIRILFGLETLSGSKGNGFPAPLERDLTAFPVSNQAL